VAVGCTLLLGVAIGLLQEGPTKTSLIAIPIHRYIGSLLPTWPSYAKGTHVFNHEASALPVGYIQIRSSTYPREQEHAESPQHLRLAGGGSDHTMSQLVQAQQAQVELKEMRAELKRTEMVSCTDRRNKCCCQILWLIRFLIHFTICSRMCLPLA
jgi:hypothetical protein